MIMSLISFITKPITIDNIQIIDSKYYYNIIYKYIPYDLIGIPCVKSKVSIYNDKITLLNPSIIQLFQNIDSYFKQNIKLYEPIIYQEKNLFILNHIPKFIIDKIKNTKTMTIYIYIKNIKKNIYKNYPHIFIYE